MERIINQNAVLKNIETTPYIGFPVLEAYPQVRCGFSTRLGGISKGIFSSMNLAFNRGDPDENVIENYRRICSSIGIPYQDLVLTDQVHNTVVRLAGKEDCGKGMVRERDYSGVDGHITGEAGVPLLVFGSDCVPLFFFDPKRNAIGVAHAGWKGTVGKIAAVAVEKMKKEFHCDPEDVLAVIGPSIGPECYEVGEDVAEAFRKAFPETELLFGKEEVLLLKKREEKGKYLLNLWEANRRVLFGAGIPEGNITISGLCTMCRQELFFSHRATAGKRGGMAGFLMLCNSGGEKIFMK